MPQKVIRFTGIDRKVNEFQNSGACEELVNLRPEAMGGHKVVRRKHRTEEVAEWYEYIYVHSFGDVENQIVVHERRGIDWVNPEAGTVVNVTGEFAGKDVTVSSAGNVLMIYCEEEKRNLAFRFEDGMYVPFSVSVRAITKAEISYAYSPSAFWGAQAADGSASALNEALLKAASNFHSNYPNGLCGAAVVGCTYELEDGSEIWSTAFVVANVTRCNTYEKPSLMETNANYVTVTGATRVSLRLTLADELSNEVRKINVYASKPVLPFEIEKPAGGSVTVNELDLDEDLNLGGQLMYYQGSVSLDKSTASLTLRFGTEQMGEKVMEVNSGCIERTGDTVSYNNRFHFYRSEVQHVVQVPTVSDAAEGRESASCWIAYAKIEGAWKLTSGTYRFSEGVPNDFIYPMAGVERIAFVKAYGSWISVPYDEMFYVDLKDSSAYNYSYAFGVVPSVVDASIFEAVVEEAGQMWHNGIEPDRTAFLKSETNAINVSAQYNPFVFPVEYSYSFGGEIRDIATSYLPISSTQVGQYPLTVFTSAGVFAMEQGNGSVLYSNIVPLQPMVIDGRGVSTPFGTFFISSRSLYLLSGRDAVSVSDILDGGRELNLRDNASYRRLCCDDSGTFFDFTPALSVMDFEDFVKDAVLTYDQFQNELIISSRLEDVHYSYVFNLATKSFHKVLRKYLRTQPGSRYAIEVVGSGRSVVDLHTEEDGEQPVFLQSRPMSLEVFYTHIQRLLLMADAHLSDGQNLCLSVFGSDNLHDWKCIISSQKHDTVIRQIRTNRAAKSYRDYVILISGTVHTDTDLSDLIADYTVVNRRLG